MRFAVVSYHLPHPDGTATGRHVYAVWDAVRAMGHHVEAWCWGDAPAGLEPPEWVTVRPVRDQRSKLATLRRPRWGLAMDDWRPPAEAVGWAEEPESYAAIASAERRGTTTYHSELLDALALRRFRPAVVQSMRAERRAVRGADVAITFSARVARAVGIPHRCPVTQPIPTEVLPVVAEPVAVLLANWGWPPNRQALQRLLAQWPQVRRRVPDAR
ncbi:MAG TPA: hypothetical protein VG708_14100, partial [Mycobacteriales bacterium]|nr:hypothetical protein [Mycobacteriales bacterium]